MILRGIITEHLRLIESQGFSNEINKEHVHLVWHTFAHVAEIGDLNQVPKLEDPEHPHVKAILTIYSLESFLFKKLNQSCREQDTSTVKTLGPFAVALSKVINNIQRKRKDKTQGNLTCYSGICLDSQKVNLWKT